MPLIVTPTVVTLYKNATGDVGVTKTLNVINYDGSVKDLTGLSATLKVWDGDPAQPLLTRAIFVLTPPNAGQAQWEVSSSDIAALPISYTGLKASIQFTATGYQDHTDPFTLVVAATA
jgi:hypothetical protein